MGHSVYDTPPHTVLLPTLLWPSCVCVTLSGDPESTLFRLTVNRITTEDAANAYDIATTTYMYGQCNAGMKHTERMISQLRRQAWDRGLIPQISILVKNQEVICAQFSNFDRSRRQNL